jgi:hypothetical protein
MTDIVWVAEDDWSKVVDGQRVRLTNDNGSLEGIAFQGNTSFVYLDRHGSNPFYSVYWKLFVEAKPLPALPTETGSVIRINGEFVVWQLFHREVWKNTVSPDECMAADLAVRLTFPGAGSFVRLEPVTVTAKKVAEWLFEQRREILEAMDADDVRCLCADLTAAFGVTS